MRIEKNQNYNSIELYFDSIPNKETRETLKNVGYRWHGVKKCWYARETEQTQTIAERLAKEQGNEEQTKTSKEEPQQPKLKTLRKATDEEKRERIAEDWQDDRMQNFIFNEYDIYITSDNLYFEVEKFNKLSINKTIWYDDELPADQAPQADLNNFININTYHCNHYDNYKEELKRLSKFYFCQNNNNSVYIDYDRRNYCDEVPNIMRPITDEEMADILTIYEERKNNYIERLKKYFRKYGEHIHSEGYWVNR